MTNSSEFDFNPNLLMEDCISKGEMSYLDERNEIVNNILQSLDPTQINAPFPFVKMNETDPRYKTIERCDETKISKHGDRNIKTGFIHYKLREVNCTNKEKCPPIPYLTFSNTIIWLKENLWCTKRPAVHGDLTVSNLFYNPPYLFIIDFEPGMTVYLNTENYIEFIETDINDLFDSYKSFNNISDSDFDSDSLLLEYREKLKNDVKEYVKNKIIMLKPPSRWAIPQRLVLQQAPTAANEALTQTEEVIEEPATKKARKGGTKRKLYRKKNKSRKNKSRKYNNRN